MRIDSPTIPLLAPLLALALFLPLASCGDGQQPWYAITTAITERQTVAVGESVTVLAGDTVYGIATRRGVPVRGVIDANNLSAPYRIVPGQKLAIPVVKRHVVSSHETLYGISRRYGADMTTLAALNDISPPYRVHRGQSLRLPARATEPSATPVIASAAEEPLTVPTEVSEPLTTGNEVTGVVVMSSLPAPQPADRSSLATPPVSGKRFIWPAQGKVLSSYGPKDDGRRNNGVNIALPENAPVKAANGGIVAYAGNGLEGYGNLLLIRHEDGWVTAYAHNNELLVRRGDRVDQGQVVARVGKTGGVETPQLHFELRRGADAVDPAEYII